MLLSFSSFRWFERALPLLLLLAHSTARAAEPKVEGVPPPSSAAASPKAPAPAAGTQAQPDASLPPPSSAIESSPNRDPGQGYERRAPGTDFVVPQSYGPVSGAAAVPPSPYPPPAAGVFSGLSPYSYAWAYDTPMRPKARPLEMKSPALVAVGISMTIVGVAALFAGSALIATSNERIDVYCDGPVLCAKLDDIPLRGAGIAMMIGGTLLEGIGLPLWILGARRVPERNAPSDPKASAANARATLRLGSTSARFVLRF